MSINAPLRVIHTFRNVEGGMDSGRAPNILAPNQLAFGVNLTVRGGYPMNRPGRFKLDLSDSIEKGRFQGAGTYQKPNGKTSVVVSVSGRIYLITPDDQPKRTATVTEITIAGDPNSPVLTQCWMVQAEDFLIIQDGESRPFIYNGVVSRRASGREVPIGTRMAYGNGRLWVADGRQFVAGDLVGSSSGTSAYSFRDAVLNFTENDYLNEGGAFGVPMQSGEITGMTFISNLDTTLGDGELIVFTRKAVYSVNVPADRTVWKDLQNPLQRVALLSYGARSQAAIVNVNSDLFFRSEDGIRSLIFARREFGTWGNTPVSNEVGRILVQDDRNLLTYASGVVFDNRLLLTCSPAQDATYGVSHRGIISLDFDLISGMAGKAPPAYDGLWTGFKVLQVVKDDFGNIERCFYVVLNSDNEIELWEQTTNDTADRPDSTTATPIKWEVSYASGVFGDGGEELKFLQTGDIWVDSIHGEAAIAIQYRPDQYPIWNDWHSWSICAENTVCVPDCTTLVFPLPQFRTRRTLPQPLDIDETTDDKPFRFGYEFQPKITITGSCRIRKFRLHAERRPEYVDGQCQNDEVCAALVGCDENLFSYNSDP